MPGQKPYTFPLIPALADTTELYTQRRTSVSSPQEYRFTVADLIAFMLDSYNFVFVASDTKFADDSAAATGGVPVGEFYELSADNVYGLPEGLLKRRIA